MKPFSFARKTLLLCQLLPLAIVLASCAEDDIPAYKISTGSVSGNYQDVGVTIASVVNRDVAANNFRLEDALSSGSISNINAITSGSSQFGLVQADDQYHAVMGLEEWADAGPQTDLRAVFAMYTEAVTLIAGGNTGIETMADLRGKAVDVGVAGSGTHRNALAALRAAGIDEKADINAREEKPDDRLEKFIHGQVDAYFFTVGHPNNEIEFATFSVRGARLISLTNIDQLIAQSPYYSRLTLAPALYPMSKGSGPAETVGVNAALLTSASVADEVVYTLTKSVFENLADLSKYDVELTALKDGTFLEGLTAPIHPGALRYFREVGIDVPSS
jgi:hypothetical protein